MILINHKIRVSQNFIFMHDVFLNFKFYDILGTFRLNTLQNIINNKNCYIHR